jgi:YVTN family beta-propeller protein
MNIRILFKRPLAIRATLLLTLILTLVFTSSRLQADIGTCEGRSITLPFTDVRFNPFLCQIAEAFFSDLIKGTTAITYSPNDPVPRDEMAAIVTRTLDQSLRRGSERAAMKRFWIGKVGFGTLVGSTPRLCECDGEDVWVANSGDGTVSRVSATDGKLLQTWTGVTNAFGVVVVNDHIFVTGNTSPGKIFKIIASNNVNSNNVGPVFTHATIGSSPEGIAFDGTDLWTANSIGSVSRVNASNSTFPAATFTTGFVNPRGILFDGTNIWVTDSGDDTLKKLDDDGRILQTINVGNGPRYPVYDGTNIWVPNQDSNTITVVRASTGQVLATISTIAPAGLLNPQSAAFDGEKIIVVGNSGAAAFYKATDLTLITTRNATINGQPPFGTCSDGTRFFFTVPQADKLLRF